MHVTLDYRLLKKIMLLMIRERKKFERKGHKGLLFSSKRVWFELTRWSSDAWKAHVAATDPVKSSLNSACGITQCARMAQIINVTCCLHSSRVTQEARSPCLTCALNRHWQRALTHPVLIPLNTDSHFYRTSTCPCLCAEFSGKCADEKRALKTYWFNWSSNSSRDCEYSCKDKVCFM